MDSARQDVLNASAVSELRCALSDLSPEHDTPIGLIHPYWARKPMNVIDAIITHLSTPGDQVVDPFMGSGTTVFAALRMDRSVVGSDLSPLSQSLVSGVLNLIEHAEVVVPEIERILNEHRRRTLPWFAFDGSSYVERVRYSVRGDFADGAFELDPTEIVTKRPSGASWTGRRAHSDGGGRMQVPRVDESERYLIDNPIDFGSISLPFNSRIAIPRGATLAHYFTPENQASINVLLHLIQESPLQNEHSAALKLVLSASLPLLRLSDKKASSQWPYWRPKSDLTSRNPTIVLASRYKQISRMIEWARDHIPAERVAKRYELLTVAAQDLTVKRLDRAAALVLTDPPYGDQVPYMEYSAMWNGVLDLAVPIHANGQELVRSDAAHRQSDSEEYLTRLKDAFAANARLLKPGGFLAWFYQDQDLNCWNAIHEAATEARVRLLDVIPVPKQRRSLKTITSPNTTLDGDLLCIFALVGDEQDAHENPIIHSYEQDDARTDGSYFERYAILISAALKSGTISCLAKQYGTVKRALAAKGA